MNRFSSKDNGETVTLGFDFTAVLASGETISTAAFAVRVVTGTDASPSSMLSGSETISGATVTHKITGGTTGVTYRISCSITTSSSHTYIESADLEVVERE